MIIFLLLNNNQEFLGMISKIFSISKIFLTQLEVPKDVTLHCLKTAKKNGCLTILNPAPASEITKEFIKYY